MLVFLCSLDCLSSCPAQAWELVPMQPAEPMPEETNCNHRQNDRDVRPRPKIAFSSQALKLNSKRRLESKTGLPGSARSCSCRPGGSRCLCSATAASHSPAVPCCNDGGRLSLEAQFSCLSMFCYLQRPVGSPTRLQLPLCLKTGLQRPCVLQARLIGMS